MKFARGIVQYPVRCVDLAKPFALASASAVVKWILARNVTLYRMHVPDATGKAKCGTAPLVVSRNVAVALFLLRVEELHRKFALTVGLNPSDALTSVEIKEL